MRPAVPGFSFRARLAALAATALLCATAGSGQALAVPASVDAWSSLQVMQQGGGVSLSQATRMVQERTGGQVLRAETRRDKGRTVHRIRVLTEDGRVRNWNVDAETGRMY